MRKITPLDALILAKAKQGQSSPQFVIKTRACVAISTIIRKGAQRNHISTQTEGLACQAAPICMKRVPPTGAMVNHPEIKNLQQSASHTWASTQAKPTTGSR
jgi:hypothetical protein